MAKHPVWLAILCVVAAFSIFDFVSVLPPCPPSHQEQAEQGAEKSCGFTQSFTYRGAEVVFEWIDHRHDFVTAAATIVIALFTISLWRATDKLWKAGERQMELIRQNAADQSVDTRASIAEAIRSAAAMEHVATHIAISAQAAQDSVTITRERSAAQMRAYLAVIIGNAIYQERDKQVRFEGKPLIVYAGFTPAYKVRYRAKSALLPIPMPADFDFSVGAAEATGGVIGAQQNSIMSAVVDDYVPDEIVDDFKVGKGKALHVWGVVYYDDIFGLPRRAPTLQPPNFSRVQPQGGVRFPCDVCAIIP